MQEQVHDAGAGAILMLERAGEQKSTGLEHRSTGAQGHKLGGMNMV